MAYQRLQAATLAERLAEPPCHLHVIAGPRQAGKATLVQQVVDAAGLSVRSASSEVWWWAAMASR